VEPWHRVAVPGGDTAAALRPPDQREERDALLDQPRALLAGGEVEVRLGPPPWPVVLLAVEPGGAHPVLVGEVVAVVDAQPALFGRVDEEEPPEGPERLATQAGLGFLVDD